MRLPEHSLPSLTSAPVTITGSWRLSKPPSGHRKKPYYRNWPREWHGLAQADHAVAAMAMVATERFVHWTKTAEIAPTLHIRFQWPAFYRDPTFKAASLTIGGTHCIARCRVKLFHRRPAIRRKVLIHTGEFFHILTVRGQPQLDFYLLFLDGCQVKMGRGRRWRLRHQGHPLLPMPIKEALTQGRTGTIHFWKTWGQWSV